MGTKLIVKFEGKRLLGAPKLRWGVAIVMNLKGVQC
jgi:hypothetical protein